jgi:hypothetical protein
MRLWAIVLGLFVLVGGANPPQTAPSSEQEVFALLIAQGAICGGGSTDASQCDHQCCLMVSTKAQLHATTAQQIKPSRSVRPFPSRICVATAEVGQRPPVRGPPVFIL